MSKRNPYTSAAWAMVALLVLAGCGSPSTTGDGANATAANVTFKTDPPAAVWIDGTDKGMTPVVVAVEAGEHEIAFKADGFEPASGKVTVEAGKDITVETALAVAAGDEESTLTTLTAALGIEREAFGEIKVHRGAGDESVMLYWPQDKVRKEGLSTYRIEVTADYEGDGFVEFRKGSDVLHRESFEPEGYVTERALPASVLEAIKRGRTIEWGVYYESRSKKAATAKFKVVDGRTLERKLAKIKQRKVYQRAKPIDREMAKIELLRNYRFYSEALTASMSVLNTWPETQLPFKAIAASLERLKLKDTTLYTEVASRVRGGKSRFAKGGGLGDVKGLGGAGPLPPSLVAPKVRAERESSGMQAGGMGVTPTPDAQKRQPGAIDPTDGGATAQPGGVAVSPRGGADALARQARVDAMKEQLKQLEQEAGVMGELEKVATEAEEQLNAARAAVDEASQAVAEATEELALAEEANDAGAIATAKQKLDTARAAAAAADGNLQASEAGKMEADKNLSEAIDRSGDARQKVDELKAQIEEASKPLPHEEVPADAPTQPNPLDPRSAAGLPNAEEAQQAAEEAQRDLQDARNYVQDATERAGLASEALDQARTSLETIEGDRTALDTAAAAVAAAEALGVQADIDAAALQLEQATQAYDNAIQQALEQVQNAENEKARAEMDAERAGVTELTAAQKAEQAQQILDAALNANPPDGVKK